MAASRWEVGAASQAWATVAGGLTHKEWVAFVSADAIGAAKAAWARGWSQFAHAICVWGESIVAFAYGGAIIH